jgi:hypothetical protein
MDTSWSAALKFLASPVSGCAHADLGKPAALAMAGKQRPSQTAARARGLRCAAMAAGTELTKDIRQIPGRSVVPVPASVIGVSWHLPAPDAKAVR